MTSPLVSPEVDLRDFAYMPLDVLRLRDSDLFVHASAEEFRAAVILWCASWHQIPAASLPDDDKTLADLAGYGRDIRGWRKVREGALRKWIVCNDERLYHPVVAEKAREAWGHKTAHKTRMENARKAKAAKNDRSNDGSQNATTSEPTAQSVTVSIIEPEIASSAGLNGTERNGTEDKKEPKASAFGSACAPAKPKRPRIKSAIDPDAQPSTSDRESSTKTGLNEDQFRTEWRKFRDYHLAKGSLMADWSAAWRTWLGNIGKFQGNQTVASEGKSIHAAAKRLHERIVEGRVLDLGAAPPPLVLTGNRG